MERRKANNSFAKLIRSEQNGNALNRSTSMRASFRLLKGKLKNNPIIQSPFKIQGNLSLRGKKLVNKATAAKLLDDMEDTVTVITHKFNDKLRKDKQNLSGTHDNNIEIEKLMSTLPLGQSVPRKACKILQIPETYCLKYLTEQRILCSNIKATQVPTPTPTTTTTTQPAKTPNKIEETQEFSSESKVSTKEETVNVQITNYEHHARSNNEAYENFTRTASSGIYGTTRMKTATIKKPTPYLNSSRCQV